MHCIRSLSWQAAFALVLPGLGLVTPRLAAQIPQVPPGQQLPTPEQAREALQNQPQMIERLRQRLLESGLTPDQVRSRLRAAGYPETLLDDYLMGADTTRAGARPTRRTIDAVRSLGILSEGEADSLAVQDSTLAVSDSLQQVLDSIQLVKADSARADSLADSLAVIKGQGLKLFGLETFRRTSTRFQPVQAGPVDENYRLGSGDVLVLILTGDVEEVYTLNVTREGFVVIPQVGQVYVANLTLGQLEDQLYARLRRVYSGVRRSPNATTRFQISLARLRNIQVFVIGDVVRPGAYQISAAGTVLTALYAAGGPSTNGSFRKVEVRRADSLISTIDVYDYLLHGINASQVRLQNGDVVFVPVHSGFVKVAGEVTRPAVYEVLPDETLRDLLQFAGGFGPAAYQTRVRIHRILPPESRSGTRARVVVDVAPEQLASGTVPAVPMAAGDSVTVLSIADRLRGYVTVRGNVWVEGQVGFRSGMKLSEAIRLAGGPKPDVYLERILVSRTNDDSSRVQLRSAFADSTGAVVNDLVLQEEDEIRIFSRAAFLPTRYVTVVGAVRNPGRVPFREGMTMRDLVLMAQGVTEDADLREAEIARRAESDDPGALAQTIRVRLDSTALASGGTDGVPLAPPHAGGAAGVPDLALKPYDNVLIRRQPGWETQRLVYLTGQVKHPGRYALKTKTDRVRDLIERAGGLTDEAYADGIQFYRSYRPGLQPRDELPPRLDQDPETRRDSLPAGYTERVGIDLPDVLNDDDDRDNVILAGGDSIHIPEYNPIIMVQGAVNSPGAVPYNPGKKLDWYVDAAGGYTQLSDTKHAYVTQPNGKREGVKRRVVLRDDVPKPKPGAVVFIPAKRIQEQPSNITAVIGTVAQVLTGLITLIIVADQSN